MPYFLIYLTQFDAYNNNAGLVMALYLLSHAFRCVCRPTHVYVWICLCNDPYVQSVRQNRELITVADE